ncbi:DNA adenine methylase [Yoonia sp. R2-816]|uniref:DNA adenine methylase n=1 Tax=Yoonia sp. R2-816 TaxID=3342638 RepID=UPI003726A198
MLYVGAISYSTTITCGCSPLRIGSVEAQSYQVIPTKPFIKWLGGKRWLVESNLFHLPEYSGRFIEPFLGGGVVFFHQTPKNAALSDVNSSKDCVDMS